MRPPLRGLDVAILDVETTGLYPGRSDRIVEVAILRGRTPREATRAFNTVVNPERDVGPTRIHGLRAEDVRHAPTFREIAGDIAEAISGAVLVGHNVSFDARFLEAEFRRAGCQISLTGSLCTMRLGGFLGVEPEGRSLADYCDWLGVPHERAHAAMPDARATAGLLDAYVDVADRKDIRALQELPLEVSPIRFSSRATLESSGRVCPRTTRPRSDAQPSWLARLAHRLPPAPASTGVHAHSGYFELLDRVLDDGLISESEAAGLVELAEVSGLTRADLEAAHRLYLQTLASAALRDSIVTDVERRELDAVAEMLGLPRSEVEAALASTDANLPALPAGVLSAENLEGQTVCFTGEALCNFQGAPITRELAEYLAIRAGLVPVKSVTRKLDILVVADRYTQSGKADKARRYGTRIMTEPVFWRTLGVAVQ